MKKTSKKDLKKIQEELRKRVIEKDRSIKERREEEELLKANKEALIELTDLSHDEVNQIEEEIKQEFIESPEQRKNRYLMLVLWISLFALIVGAGVIIIQKTDLFFEHVLINDTIYIDVKTHHLGDNPGNEGREFSKEFKILDLSRCESAIFSVSFTKWGPNTKKAPIVIINSDTIGSVIENLPPPGTDDCWGKPSSDNSYDYNCDFTYQKEVKDFIKEGKNSFKLKSRKYVDDFLFLDVYIILKKRE